MGVPQEPQLLHQKILADPLMTLMGLMTAP